MIQGMYSVLDTVMKWALNNKVKEVIVLEGIPVEGIPDSKRTPMVLSSDGEAAGSPPEDRAASRNRRGARNPDRGLSWSGSGGMLRRTPPAVVPRPQPFMV